MPRTPTPTPPGLRAGAKPARVLTFEPVPVYALADLTGKARERALEWLAEASTSEGCLEGWRDSCLSDLEAMGFEVDRDEPRRKGGQGSARFFFDLGHSQGDGVGFAATLRLSKLAAFDMKAHAPSGDLPNLGPLERERLGRLLKLAPDAIATVETVGSSGVGTQTSLSVEGADLPTEEDTALEDAVSFDLSAWVDRLCSAFKRSGYAELDHLGSPEACAESAEANGYTFTADGKREG